MWSKTTEYALRALIYIALSNKEGRRPGFREIAEAIGAPVQFTAKILQQMARTHLLSSVRGKGGGFFFKGDQEETTLTEVIKALEGQDYYDVCALGLKNCDSEHPCPLHNEFHRIRSELATMSNRETIQGLAAKISNGEAKLKRV
jgi:Rrf2 family protein